MWAPDPGVRLEAGGRNYAAPRIAVLSDGRYRLYCYERGRGIISALSEDGGLTFRQEPGLRIAQDGTYDAQVAFAPSICFKLAIQALVWLLVRALTKFGIAIAANRPMIATTIIISMSVNPICRFTFMAFL